MWNRSIALPKRKEEEQDEEGFSEKEISEWEKGIPANFTDITRNDEILAAHKGYRADQNIEIMACNYRGQSFLKDESSNQLYEIKRTFQKDKSSKIILTCERSEYGKI